MIRYEQFSFCFCFVFPIGFLSVFFCCYFGAFCLVGWLVARCYLLLFCLVACLCNRLFVCSVLFCVVILQFVIGFAF